MNKWIFALGTVGALYYFMTRPLARTDKVVLKRFRWVKLDTRTGMQSTAEITVQNPLNVAVLGFGNEVTLVSRADGTVTKSTWVTIIAGRDILPGETGSGLVYLTMPVPGDYEVFVNIYQGDFLLLSHKVDVIRIVP